MRKTSRYLFGGSPKTLPNKKDAKKNIQKKNWIYSQEEAVAQMHQKQYIVTTDWFQASCILEYLLQYSPIHSLSREEARRRQEEVLSSSCSSPLLQFRQHCFHLSKISEYLLIPKEREDVLKMENLPWSVMEAVRGEHQPQEQQISSASSSSELLAWIEEFFSTKEKSNKENGNHHHHQIVDNDEAVVVKEEEVGIAFLLDNNDNIDRRDIFGDGSAVKTEESGMMMIHPKSAQAPVHNGNKSFKSGGGKSRRYIPFVSFLSLIESLHRYQDGVPLLPMSSNYIHQAAAASQKNHFFVHPFHNVPSPSSWELPLYHSLLQWIRRYKRAYSLDSVVEIGSASGFLSQLLLLKSTTTTKSKNKNNNFNDDNDDGTGGDHAISTALEGANVQKLLSIDGHGHAIANTEETIRQLWQKEPATDDNNNHPEEEHHHHQHQKLKKIAPSYANRTIATSHCEIFPESWRSPRLFLEEAKIFQRDQIQRKQQRRRKEWEEDGGANATLPPLEPSIIYNKTMRSTASSSAEEDASGEEENVQFKEYRRFQHTPWYKMVIFHSPLPMLFQHPVSSPKNIEHEDPNDLDDDDGVNNNFLDKNSKNKEKGEGEGRLDDPFSYADLQTLQKFCVALRDPRQSFGIPDQEDAYVAVIRSNFYEVLREWKEKEKEQEEEGKGGERRNFASPRLSSSSSTWWVEEFLNSSSGGKSDTDKQERNDKEEEHRFFDFQICYQEIRKLPKPPKKDDNNNNKKKANSVSDWFSQYCNEHAPKFRHFYKGILQAREKRKKEDFSRKSGGGENSFSLSQLFHEIENFGKELRLELTILRRTPKKDGEEEEETERRRRRRNNYNNKLLFWIPNQEFIFGELLSSNNRRHHDAAYRQKQQEEGMSPPSSSRDAEKIKMRKRLHQKKLLLQKKSEGDGPRAENFQHSEQYHYYLPKEGIVNALHWRENSPNFEFLDEEGDEAEDREEKAAVFTTQHQQLVQMNSSNQKEKEKVNNGNNNTSSSVFRYDPYQERLKKLKRLSFQSGQRWKPDSSPEDTISAYQKFTSSPTGREGTPVDQRRKEVFDGTKTSSSVHQKLLATKWNLETVFHKETKFNEEFQRKAKIIEANVQRNANGGDFKNNNKIGTKANFRQSQQKNKWPSTIQRQNQHLLIQQKQNQQKLLYQKLVRKHALKNRQSVRDDVIDKEWMKQGKVSTAVMNEVERFNRGDGMKKDADPWWRD